MFLNLFFLFFCHWIKSIFLEYIYIRHRKIVSFERANIGGELTRERENEAAG